jgi:hypothetical protein
MYSVKNSQYYAPRSRKGLRTRLQDVGDRIVAAFGVFMVIIFLMGLLNLGFVVYENLIDSAMASGSISPVATQRWMQAEEDISFVREWVFSFGVPKLVEVSGYVFYELPKLLGEMFYGLISR